MEQLHAHEVLHMMEGNSYSEASLREAIIQQFGEQQHFYACSAEDMDVDTLIEFLKKKGKFKPVENGLTVAIRKVCNHKASVPHSTRKAAYRKSEYLNIFLFLFVRFMNFIYICQ